MKQFLNIVNRALNRYDVDVKKISFLTEETNILFKIEDYSGNFYVLKLFQEESSSLEDNLTEVFFTHLLTKNNNIALPKVIPAKDGSYVQQIQSSDTYKPRRLVLYSWLEGEDLDGNESDKLFIQLGELTAHLHQTTYGINIPDNISPKKWDKVFFYNEEKAVYKNLKYKEFLTQEYLNLMDNIIPFLDEALITFYKENADHWQLIHGDLNPWNIKVFKDKLRVIDFEDVMLGLPIHDISIILYYYDYEEKINFEEVKSLFFQGYEKVRPLPSFTDYDIDLLMTARRVNFLNYILLISEEPINFINTNVPRVMDFIKKYNIQLG